MISFITSCNQTIILAHAQQIIKPSWFTTHTQVHHALLSYVRHQNILIKYADAGRALHSRLNRFLIFNKTTTVAPPNTNNNQPKNRHNEGIPPSSTTTIPHCPTRTRQYGWGYFSISRCKPFYGTSKKIINGPVPTKARFVGHTQQTQQVKTTETPRSPHPFNTLDHNQPGVPKKKGTAKKAF